MGNPMALRPNFPVDVATATQRAMRSVRARMEGGRSYLMAVCDERNIVAQCIADMVINGAEVWPDWLEEYFVLCQIRDRTLATWEQERRELAAAAAAERQIQQIVTAAEDAGK